jgi:Animal haem peroxidase
MERHGSESYFVIGEGLLTESGEGRDAPVALAADATAAGVGGPTALALAAAPPFRFSRIGPRGPRPAEGLRRRLANAMTASDAGPSSVPAGFTYLGQFIDHDLSFDKTQVMLGESVSPTELLQGRSPSLDLDSLYGAGPDDPESAKFYRDGVHLKMGRTVAVPPDGVKDGFDLPRNTTGGAAARRKALIPDHRNDENLAVAQTHLAFIRFHERVVDTLPPTPVAQRFPKARRLVVNHYQWMIRTDYLPRICDPGVVDDVFSNGRKIFEPGVDATTVPTMPIEFAIAAFRLGHSMIRQAYDWNRRFDDGAGTLDLLFEFSGTGGSLGGDTRLPSNWIADFRRLYDFTEAGRADLAPPPGKLNRAKRIDSRLVRVLKNLPPGSFGGPPVPFDDPTANLAFRNLTRARMVRLATGQQMAAHLRANGVPVTTLTPSQVVQGNGGADLDNLTQAQRQQVRTETPLFFYILREAELNGGKLAGVGARIVAETFHRAMEGSQPSIVRNAAWRPSFGPDSDTFRMTDLLLFAFEGSEALLNPLGGP